MSMIYEDFFMLLVWRGLGHEPLSALRVKTYRSTDLLIGFRGTLSDSSMGCFTGIGDIEISCPFIDL